MFNGIKKAGGISFGVSMVTSQLGKDTTKARKMLGGFVDDTKKRLAGLRNSFSGVGTSLAAAFSVGAVAGFAKRQFDMIDALHDTSKNLGITTEGLSRLNFAAEQSGASQEAMEKSLAKMVRSTRDASLGLETYQRAYDKLGLNAKELMKLAPEQQFAEIADAVKNLKSENDQLTVAQDIFGRSGKELVETLRLGKQGLSGMADEADRVGATINGIDAANVAKAADEINKLKKQLAGIGNQLAVDLGPGAVGFAQRVSTGLSVMSGGSGGETVAEKQLRERMGLKAEQQNNLLAEAQARFERKRQQELGRTWVQRAGEANRKDRAQFGMAVGAKDALAGGVADFAKKLGTTVTQIATGVATSSEARIARETAFKDILNRSAMSGGATDATWKKITRKESQRIRSFDAVESGSLAAYQQRLRGQQQFEKARPIEEKQLATLEKIAAALENPAEFMIAEGSV